MTEFLRPTSKKRLLFFLLSDLLLSLLTLYLSYELRFNFDIDPRFLKTFWHVFATIALLKLGAIYLFRGYFVVWRFFGFEDAKNVFKAHLAAYGLFVLLYLADGSVYAPFPRSVIGIDFFLSLIMIGALRAFKRMLLGQTGRTEVKAALIYGANAKTAGMIRSALDGDVPYYPVAIVAAPDESGLAGSTIANVRVFDDSEIDDVILKQGAEAAIIAAAMPQKTLQTLVERLNAGGITEIKRVRLLGGKDERLEDLSIEDLLARNPQDLDADVIAGFIAGKRVLITGAGGSIGSEIARQCERFGAAKLALIDHSEYNLYAIGEELFGAELDMFSVTDRQMLDEKMDAFGPQIVIHAAAYKHVPLCEANKEVAVTNNVLGTKNVIDASIAAGAEKLVIVSTDKAVRPTNVMGATKRVTELYAGNVDCKATEIVAVRFGNVLGSSGSVIPKFKRQIEAGGPVTVTHPEMTRYFMLIPEACQLVLQAAAIAKGGELFILDMGEPVKIVDLARQMIRLYGKEDEVQIEFCGLRPGEKLFEELLIDDTEKKTQYSSIFIAGKTDYPIAQLEADIVALLAAEDKIAALKKIVPEFDHKP